MSIPNEPTYGPTLKISEEIHAMKYREKLESFKECVVRNATAMTDSQEHFTAFKDILLNMRFLAAGRVQAAMGAVKVVTPYNCFVSETIEDSMEGIMTAVTRAAQTMRLGGGIGYDFSTIRPAGDMIRSLESRASGPIPVMGIFDATCAMIASAGHRRGAQMGVLRVDHPDIEEFIRAKQNDNILTNFNISVGITNEFMACVEHNKPFDLRYNGKVYRTINATALWDEILRATWDWAEPGVLFIDQINEKNNLYYCESIVATNPCGEQPLPPNGACLLGSFNLVKYVNKWERQIDYKQLADDIPHVVRAMDNVIDRAVYPLMEQEQEAKSKRRMGLGVTGVANAIEALGYPYGSPDFMAEFEIVLKVLRNGCYNASVDLAIEKGVFPLYDAGYHKHSMFIQTLPPYLRERIERHGIRNSHLLSIAPTGTISLTADNVSSGLEPVFSYGYDRTINMSSTNTVVEHVSDYGYRVFGTKGRKADDIHVSDHVAVLNLASRYVDSACSKTCNVGDDVTWDEFKDVYMQAFKGGASGCTTFRASGKRYGILNASAVEDVATSEEPKEQDKFINETDGAACFFDPATGQRSCE